MTVHKCKFAGADALGGNDAGLNNFSVEVEEPLGHCPTPTAEVTINPYELKRKVVKNAVFLQVLPLPA